MTTDDQRLSREAWRRRDRDPSGHLRVGAIAAAGCTLLAVPWMFDDASLAGLRLPGSGIAIVATAVVALFIATSVVALLWQRWRLNDALTEISLNDYLSRVAEALPGTLLSFRTSPDGGISVPYASKNMKEIVGLEPGLLAHGAGELFARIHPDDLDRVLGDISQSAKTLALLRMEFRMTVAERGEIWIECRAMPEREATGDVLFHGFALDVTDRKHAEDRLRLASTVFTSSHDGIILTDRDRRIIAANPAFSAITGYSEQEAIGQTPHLLRSGRQDDAFYRGMWNAIAGSGYWQGEIWNRRKCGEVYPEWMTISEVRNQAGEISNYVATFADISRLKRSEAEVEHLASHDPLTGLPNRAALGLELGRRLARAGSDGGMGAVILLDLDRFRIVNDSCGHGTGDRLLKLVAERLKARTGAADVVACSGGDRFMVLLGAIETRAAAGEQAGRLRAALAEPFVLEDGQTRYVGASFGISVFPEDGGDADGLMQQAGAALNHAKASGGNAICFYSSIFTDNAVARIELETDLRRALENDEFVLQYQPLVSITDRRIKGVEALIRWRTPGGGLMPPGLFIPVAEETGLIIPLGEWVLRAACRQMMAWRGAGVMLDCIAVNLSPAQFNDPLLTQRVSDILEVTGLPPHCLEIEITEGALLGSGDEVAARLTRLKDLGVRLAIDDFGTGYSSLAYLKRFPIDKLKIDRSFINGLPDDGADAKIIHAVIEMGRSLRLEVLAEGVETEAQLALLRQQGCDTAQGFLFGAASEPETIAALAKGPLGRPAPVRGRLKTN
ncbi:MAG: EAL domain-containing protein [Xanthobacteraceae bacterium]|nr:EAL domain-containing protein [Xanthobacteraceae bacterium]